MSWIDSFGRPGEGVHEIRLCNVAVVDLALTLVVAYYLALYLNHSFWLVSACLCLLSIVVHRVVGVRTTWARLVE